MFILDFYRINLLTELFDIFLYIFFANLIDVYAKTTTYLY